MIYFLNNFSCKKRLRILKGVTKSSINHRSTDNTKAKGSRTNNDLQNITQKAKD
jgi:hypothetical protein